MSEQNSRPIMSRDVVNSGSQVSVQGYLNWKEATMVIIAALGFASVSDLIGFAAKALAENANAWVSGESAQTVAWVLSMVAGYFGSRRIAKKYSDKGERILFNPDEDAS